MSILHRATFTVSAAKLNQLPPPDAPEVCFVGRSNAGKSSAINVLAQQKRLAFSSKTPGRTRLINIFGIPDNQNPNSFLGHLVDLPGYGYASVAQTEKDSWADTLGGYLLSRTSLVGIVLLIDIRRGLTDLDRNLLKYIQPSNKPVLVLLTKADKFPYGQRIKAAFAIKKELNTLSSLHTIAFSATHRIGIEEADEYIRSWLVKSAPSAVQDESNT